MKIDRLISIMMVLLNCEKMSATKLAEMFEVTPRTIYRDINAIENAGIPIFTTTGVNGGIGILPEYKLSKNLFTASDVQTLFMGLESISTVLPQKDVVGTIEKVKQLLPPQNSSFAGKVSVDLTTWKGNKTLLQSIETIKQSLAENRFLQFAYRDKNGAKTTRKIEPYQLVLKENYWYLHGYCLERKDFRIFKVARMSALCLEKESFVARDFPTKALQNTAWIEQKLIPIQLIFKPSLYDKILELCGEENIQFHQDGWLLANFLFAPDEFGYNILLGFGDQCECISPLEVRTELKRRIHQLAIIYEK